jgi:RNA polymerase sigma-70 factor (ECF subfamily)
LNLCAAPVRRVLLDPDDVEDATQNALMAVDRWIGGFRSDAKYRTWLWTLARNEALRVLRARERQPEPVAEPDGGFVARMSSMVASAEAVYAAIGALAEPYRTVVVLRDLEQREYAEIAIELGVELGTVKSRLNRGRRMVMDALTGTVPP